MSTPLFGRVVNVILAGGNSTEGTQFEGIIRRDGFETPGFDIDFIVDRSRTSEPNEAAIRIFNLRSQTRGQFREEFKRIRLEAGYLNNFTSIFDGEIKTVTHRRTAEGYETEIIAADGELAWQKASINTTLDAPTPVQVVRTLVAAMPGVSLGRIYGLEEEPAITRPVVLNGIVWQRLNEFARSYNARWSIQNGVFEWVANTQAGDRRRILTISADTGLIDQPEPTEKGVLVRTLLQPALKPNDAVQIRSQFFDDTFDKSDSQEGGGIFRINSVSFRGSSYSDEFYAELDCQRMAGDVVEQDPTTEQATAAREARI